MARVRPGLCRVCGIVARCDRTTDLSRDTKVVRDRAVGVRRSKHFVAGRSNGLDGFS